MYMGNKEEVVSTFKKGVVKFKLIESFDYKGLPKDVLLEGKINVVVNK